MGYGTLEVKAWRECYNGICKGILRVQPGFGSLDCLRMDVEESRLFQAMQLMGECSQHYSRRVIMFSPTVVQRSIAKHWLKASPGAVYVAGKGR
jgi:hypothetical protein